MEPRRTSISFLRTSNSMVLPDVDARHKMRIALLYRPWKSVELNVYSPISPTDCANVVPRSTLSWAGQGEAWRGSSKTVFKYLIWSPEPYAEERALDA